MDRKLKKFLLGTALAMPVLFALNACNKDDDDSAGNVGDSVGEEYAVNGVKFKMVYVEGGSFMMGATPEQEEEAYDEEKPVHKVTLSSYYIGSTEVTQELWTAVMGENPSDFKGNRKPVENVNYADCQNFIAKLNKLTGENFSLPTEAQWEFAARGGNKSKGYKYAGSNNIDEVAWYGGAGFETHDVAKKRPNELGLYDMSGNVIEWCSDYGGVYSDEVQTDPEGPSYSILRVLRGGGWLYSAEKCRVSFRATGFPSIAWNYSGLRLAKPYSK